MNKIYANFSTPVFIKKDNKNNYNSIYFTNKNQYNDIISFSGTNKPGFLKRFMNFPLIKGFAILGGDLANLGEDIANIFSSKPITHQLTFKHFRRKQSDRRKK